MDDEFLSNLETTAYITEQIVPCTLVFLQEINNDELI